MRFNADGYLDAGLHDLTIDEIEEHFVVAFPTSTSRPDIMMGYKRHRTEVSKFGVDFLQLLDGSFISTKNDPADVDLVAFADADEIDKLDPADRAKLMALFSGPATKATYRCDAYFCPTVPSADPRHGRLRATRKYWMGEFGYDRTDKPKGIVRTTVDSKSSGSATPTAATTP